MATLYLLPLSLIPQWFTNLGIMAAGGTLQTYLAGTTTPVATYTDNTGLVANPNPMTLSASGRPVSASGAPVGFWVPSGTVVKFIAYDAAGNQLDALDQVAAINDPASSNSLQSLLANPASSNVAGAGPVAGVDLVANAVKSYDTFADVRAANSPILASGQTLNIQVQGALTVNDGLGGDFYWVPASTATDNGAGILKPNTVLSGSPGRWIRLGTPPFGASFTIPSALLTDLGTSPSNVVNVTGTASIGGFGNTASIARPLYLVTFAASLTLINSAVMVLPGLATQNIQTLAGDSMLVQFLGSSTWQVLGYFRAGTSPQLTQYLFVKPTDQSIASSTVLTNDNYLQVTLQPGASYLIQLRLQLQGVGGTGQGYQVKPNYGGTLTGNSAGGGVASANGTAAAIAVAVGGTLTEAALSTTGDFVNVDYAITTNAGGSFTVQFCQNSSSANATVMKAGSTMIVTRLA
jgi:hypothetical protein